MGDATWFQYRRPTSRRPATFYKHVINAGKRTSRWETYSTIPEVHGKQNDNNHTLWL